MTALGACNVVEMSNQTPVGIRSSQSRAFLLHTLQWLSKPVNDVENAVEVHPYPMLEMLIFLFDEDPTFRDRAQIGLSLHNETEYLAVQPLLEALETMENSNETFPDAVMDGSYIHLPGWESVRHAAQVARDAIELGDQ